MISVELRNIGKAFGDCIANSDINLKVEKGSIHGVIGENGAGKSTAMKILYGLFPPTSGKIFVDGIERTWRSPKEAIAAGIGMVHQHFMLSGPHSVLDNIILGVGPALIKNLPFWLNIVDRKRALKKLQDLSEKFSFNIDFKKKIEDLPVGIQQKIEILKLLYYQANILILDEPTAVLTPQEIADLFIHLRKLKDEGKTIIVITHKLKEVMELTDQISVFRGGKVTGQLNTRETNEQELANLMVGRKVLLKVDVPFLDISSNKDNWALEVNQLTLPSAGKGGGKNILSDINFQVGRGEIVGVAGIEGNGQSDLLSLLLLPQNFRLKKMGNQGFIKILGHDLMTENVETRQIKEWGVGVIPEDRHKEGLLLDFTLEENFLLGLHRRPEFRKHKRGPFLSWTKIGKKVEEAIVEFDIRPPLPKVPARSLSGGNQQKLIVAREFGLHGDFLVCAQPTRGVDVGAIEFIHKRIIERRNQGTGVLLVSSELQEIMTLSDRIVVMYEGKIVATAKRGELDETALGLLMGGANKNSTKTA